MSMGRYVEFREAAYIADLRKALSAVMDKVDKEVYKALHANLAGVKLRKLDRQYHTEMLSSIRRASSQTMGYIIKTFLAGGEVIPNQSFRVLYYEYGTGTRMTPPKGYHPSQDPFWNEDRPRELRTPHYSRRNGVWTDLGGNRHISRTRGKPRPLPEHTPRGEPVEPHFWFSKAVEAGTKNMDRLVLNAVKSVPIHAYIRIRDLEKRGL